MKNSKTTIVILVMLLFIISLSLSQKRLNTTPTQEYRYYFFKGSILSGRRNVTIIGINDTTHVKIYRLIKGGAEKILEYETIVNRFEARSIDLTTIYKNITGVYDEEVYYKIISDRRIAVLLGEGDWHIGLVPSTKGGFLGSEFVFAPGSWHGVYIYAFEDADITIYSVNGKILKKIKLWQNESTLIGLPKRTVIRVVSTGRIAIFNNEHNGGMAMISDRGRFRGKHLAGAVRTSLFITAYEPCQVKIYDYTGKLVGTHKFTKDEVESGKPFIVDNLSYLTAVPIRVIATGDVTVVTDSTGDWPAYRGNFFMYADAGEELRIYTPGILVVFTPYDCKLWIDGQPIDSIANQYWHIIGNTTHMIKADKPLIVQIIHSHTVTYVPCDRDAEIVLPQPAPSSKGKESTENQFLRNIIPAIAVIAAVAIIAIIVLKRRKSSE